MSWLPSASYWVVSATLGLVACRRGPAVQVLGESNRLERSEPSPVKSSIFDGSVVRLRGVRGETLGLEVRCSDGKSSDAWLKVPAAAASVTAFAVRSLEVREPSSSMYGPSLGPGFYPDILVPVAGPVTSPDLAYFDVAIGRRARPGRYSGELRAGGQVIPVVLDVVRGHIDLAHDPLVWAFYLPSEIAHAHGLPDVDSPELLARETWYYDLFRAHGVLLAADLSPARFAPRRSFVHDVPYWPVAIDISSDAAITDDVHRWLDLFRDLAAMPFAIPVDEPKTVEQRQNARRIAEVIGLAGGGRPSLLRGVTDVASPVYGDAIDVFLSPKNLPADAAAKRTGQRFWTYNGRPPEAGSMILDTEGTALRTWGWIAYRYGVDLWYAWEGLYFSDRYNGGRSTDVVREPITFDERSRGGTDWGNGDGVLVYPGPLPSLRLKALRRGLEDRLLLRELESCGKGDLARSLARRIVPTALGEAGAVAAWPTEESEWERARNEILNSIEEHCHDDTTVDG
jgi:Glycoside hydrolase 123, catalytic domain